MGPKVIKNEFFPKVFQDLSGCLLLAACCLLAEPGRSTLDLKEGYKTKTGSTSSMTLI